MASEINNFSAETIIAAVSAMAAVASAMYAWRASVIAKKALQIAQLDFNEKHGDIRPYLIDSMTWLSQAGDRHYSAACLFSNSSTSPITISNVELVLHIYDPSGKPVKIKVDPIQAITQLPKGLPQLNGQINLAPRTSISGWLTFKIPKHIVNTKRVDRYEIVGIDSMEKEVSIDAYVVKQVELNEI
ncbi:hypothetical protein FGKAn22_06730 [Ferrigenium kumadai]|uniref:Uncharacterized protein n=1 Tax=Ferrigenium kumadai TaxID=1682490 RepID=A0AAN1SXW4_9PROT|nr:hypothetical protein [Ferrigenium kumadai]BBI98980.1 hypothetical protein FGKAn22_06730 [Ferrigenium kumadai]